MDDTKEKERIVAIGSKPASLRGPVPVPRPKAEVIAEAEAEANDEYYKYRQLAALAVKAKLTADDIVNKLKERSACRFMDVKTIIDEEDKIKRKQSSFSAAQRRDALALAHAHRGVTLKMAEIPAPVEPEKADAAEVSPESAIIEEVQNHVGTVEESEVASAK